jgi:anti-sigma factor RsiW
MKKIPQALEEMLFDYIDGTLNAADKQRLETELSHNHELKARLDELQNVELWLSKIPVEEMPSRNFTQQVMGKLDQYPARSSSLTSRNGIFLLAGILVAVGLASILVSSGVFDGVQTTINLNQELPQKYIQKSLPPIALSGKLIVNIVILLNLGLAWLVLDRVILKPLFQRRMHAGH